MGGVHRLVAREHAGRVSTASERRGGSLAGRPRGDEDGLDPRPDQLVLGHDAAARQNRGIDRQLALQRKRRLRRGGEEETIVVRHPTTTRHEPGVGRGDRARRASRAVEGGHAPRERRPSSPESRAGGSRSRRARYLARVSAEGDRPPAGAPEMACRQAGGSTQSIPSAAREQPMTCSYAEYHDDAGRPGARVIDTAHARGFRVEFRGARVRQGEDRRRPRAAFAARARSDSTGTAPPPRPGRARTVSIPRGCRVDTDSEIL